MAIVMVSSKEQIALKLSDETATLCISSSYVGLCSHKIISLKYMPLRAIISAVMWLARFNKTLLDLTVHFPKHSEITIMIS